MRQLQKLSMRAIAAMNPEHCSCSAVSRIARATEVAFATAGIDLTNNTLTTLLKDTNKLVTDSSVETCVSTRDLEIGITDPRQRHAHECFISAMRLRYIFDCKFFLIDAEGKHRSAFSIRVIRG